MSSNREKITERTAVMFADISGSSQLYAHLGDTRAHSIIGRTLKQMAAATRAFNGTVIKTIGDELMCRFPTSDEAVDAAIEMQRQLLVQPPDAPVRVGIRIGLHWGQVVARGGDVFGSAVNVAARVAAMAKRDQIVTTDELVRSITPQHRALARQFDRVALRGRTGAVGLWIIHWEEESEATKLYTSVVERSPAVNKLRIEYGDRTVELFREGAALTLGRASECGLVVASTFASRTHARIIVRRGKFVLVDESTNGTYIVAGEPRPGAQETHIKREECPLPSGGVICLGQSALAPGSQHIKFAVCGG